MTARWALLLLSACAGAAPVSAPPGNTAPPSDREGVAGVTRVLREGGELFFLDPDAECQRWVAHPDQHELIYDNTIQIDAQCSRSFREEIWYSLADTHLTVERANSYPVSERGCGHNELTRGEPTDCNWGPTPLTYAGGGAVRFRNRMLLFLDEATCRAVAPRVQVLDHGGVCRQ